MSSADPIVTVAPGTGSRAASTTFPNRVKTGRVVVVVADGVVVDVVVVSRSVAGEATTTLVVAPPTSGPTQADATTPRARKTSRRDRGDGFTQTWYASGPAEDHGRHGEQHQQCVHGPEGGYPRSGGLDPGLIS